MSRHTARRERMPKPVSLAPTPEDARKHIVVALKRGREYTAADIAALTGMSEMQARNNALRLIEMGLLTRGKIGQTTVYKVADHPPPAPVAAGTVTRYNQRKE